MRVGCKITGFSLFSKIFLRKNKENNEENNDITGIENHILTGAMKIKGKKIWKCQHFVVTLQPKINRY